MRELVDLDVIAKIRHCANTGLVLGSKSSQSSLRPWLNSSLPGWANRLLSVAYLFTLALYSDPILSSDLPAFQIHVSGAI